MTIILSKGKKKKNSRGNALYFYMIHFPNGFVPLIKTEVGFLQSESGLADRLPGQPVAPRKLLSLPLTEAQEAKRVQLCEDWVCATGPCCGEENAFHTSASTGSGVRLSGFFCLFVFGFFFLPFLGPHLQHMEIPRLGV